MKIGDHVIVSNSSDLQGFIYLAEVLGFYKVNLNSSLFRIKVLKVLKDEQTYSLAPGKTYLVAADRVKPLNHINKK